jgi:hypothetical protein
MPARISSRSASDSRAGDGFHPGGAAGARTNTFDTP